MVEVEDCVDCINETLTELGEIHLDGKSIQLEVGESIDHKPTYRLRLKCPDKGVIATSRRRFKQDMFDQFNFSDDTYQKEMDGWMDQASKLITEVVNNG